MHASAFYVVATILCPPHHFTLCLYIILDCFVFFSFHQYVKILFCFHPLAGS